MTIVAVISGSPISGKALDMLILLAVFPGGGISKCIFQIQGLRLRDVR